MRVIRLIEVINKTGLKKTTIYKLIKGKSFPEAIALGERAVGWLESEIEAWIKDRILERDQTCHTTSPESLGVE